jgi:hypothetical protein
MIRTNLILLSAFLMSVFLAPTDANASCREGKFILKPQADGSVLVVDECQPAAKARRNIPAPKQEAKTTPQPATSATVEKQRPADEGRAKEENATKEGRCAADFKCIAESNIIYATTRCSRQVERLAKNDFKWEDRWYESKFSRYRAKKDDNSVITYLGDKIKFQNGFGAWVWHIYACDYDVKNEKVINVQAEPGRFPDN